MSLNSLQEKEEIKPLSSTVSVSAYLLWVQCWIFFFRSKDQTIQQIQHNFIKIPWQHKLPILVNLLGYQIISPRCIQNSYLLFWPWYWKSSGSPILSCGVNVVLFHSNGHLPLHQISVQCWMCYVHLQNPTAFYPWSHWPHLNYIRLTRELWFTVVHVNY